jgi:branched-chain amino acid transport system substrate-binding protein
MFKRVLPLFLVAVMFLGACAAPATPAAAPTAAPAAATAAPSAGQAITSTQPVTSSQPAASSSAGPIKIGLEIPLTGDFAFEGKGMQQSAQLVVDEDNAAGGLLGRQVQLIVDDDKGDPQQASLVADRMVSNNVIAVIGSYSSSATEPASATYNRAGILQITPSATASRLTTHGYKMFFRTCFPDDRQGLFADEYMSEVLNAKNIAILHDNSTFAQGLANDTKSYAAKYNLNIVYFDALNPKDSDFTPVLTKLKAANPDVVYFTGYYAQYGQLLKQAPSVGFKTQWLGGNGANNTQVAAIAGNANAAGAEFTTEPLPQQLTSDVAKKFLADFQAKYQTVPQDIWWVETAEAYRVVAEAIRETKSTDPKVMAAYLHSDQFKNFPGITGVIQGFDQNGDRIGTDFQAYVIGADGSINVAPKQPPLTAQ